MALATQHSVARSGLDKRVRARAACASRAALPLPPQQPRSSRASRLALYCLAAAGGSSTPARSVSHAPAPRRAPRPLPPRDGSRELHAALALASEEELSALEAVLFGSSPFSPSFKNVSRGDGSWAWQPAAAPSDAASRRAAAAQRLLFLAAGSGDTVRGRRPSYRAALLGLRAALRCDCAPTLATVDLEAELYLALTSAEAGRGAAVVASAAGGGAAAAREGGSFAERLLAPLRLGGEALLPALAAGAGAAASAALRAGAVRRAAHAAAARGAAAAAARSAAGAVATRAAFAAVSPLLWLSLAVDLGIKATGPDYGRVARAVALIAQIRLLRTHGWSEGTAALGNGSDTGNALPRR
jgi:hypothetical protein